MTTGGDGRSPRPDDDVAPKHETPLGPGDQAYSVKAPKSRIRSAASDLLNRWRVGRRVMALRRHARKELAALWVAAREPFSLRSPDEDQAVVGGQPLTTVHLAGGVPSTLEAIANEHEELAQVKGGGFYAPPGTWHHLLTDLPPYPPDAALYLASEAPRESAAPLLYLEGLAPRPYDFLEVEGASIRAMVASPVEPRVEGAPPPALISRLEGLSSAGELQFLNGAAIADGPFGEDAPGTDLYLGWERVAVARRANTLSRVVTREAQQELHYGSELRLHGGRYLYQSVPGLDAAGRRKTSRRWNLISSLLETHDVDLRGRTILDIGCNAGMILASSLAAGAHWGLGWDRIPVVQRARELLLALGFTRFELTGGDLDQDHDLVADVPSHLRPHLDGSLIYYLAIRHHLGFLSQLADIPWRYMVYEGGETEAVATLSESLRSLRGMCEVEILAATDFRDGETGTRPVALITRK